MVSVTMLMVSFTSGAELLKETTNVAQLFGKELSSSMACISSSKSILTLKVTTDNLKSKLWQGRYELFFEGTLLCIGTKVAVKHLDGLGHVKSLSYSPSKLSNKIVQMLSGEIAYI
ncbi:hypothetical protein HYC85_014275 [Camellia sinensis]|uniref:Uncharacterized protein n=1 Tax=Camellia sinensis TaxID=4442 RepID=A0A7J7H963_CAMSI|nr:hypothetical protein HYC85_014275 [Camellia sinensis]